MSQEIESNNHSGGVKTPEGKAITRYNAQRHAILRQTITEYEKADQEEIFNGLAEDLKPQSYLQEKVAEIIGSNLIKLQRIAVAESDTIKEALAPMIQTEFSEYDMMHGPAYKKYKSKISNEIANRLLLLSRYQTATENRIYRAIMMFKQLQNEQGKTN